MSYSRFLTPRIYTDIAMSLLSRGLDPAEIAPSGVSVDSDSDILDLFNGRPAQTVTFDTTSGGSTSLVITLDTTLSNEYPQLGAFILLNTNFPTVAGVTSPTILLEHSSDGSSWVEYTPTAVVNCSVSGNDITMTEDGSLIATVAPPETTTRYVRATFDCDPSWNLSTDLFIGGLFFAQVYDFAHGPDLAVKTALEYRGTKQKTAESGAIYSTAKYLGGGAGHPFRNEDSLDPLLQRDGRRVVDCEFSHIDDTELLPSDGSFALTSTDSLESLLQRVAGGHLPCVFTPDGSSTTAGDYVFGRIDGKKAKPTQIANRVWRHGFRFVEDF